MINGQSIYREQGILNLGNLKFSILGW